MGLVGDRSGSTYCFSISPARCALILAAVEKVGRSAVLLSVAHEERFGVNILFVVASIPLYTDLVQRKACCRIIKHENLLSTETESAGRRICSVDRRSVRYNINRSGATSTIVARSL